MWQRNGHAGVSGVFRSYERGGKGRQAVAAVAGALGSCLRGVSSWLLGHSVHCGVQRSWHAACLLFFALGVGLSELNSAILLAWVLLARVSFPRIQQTILHPHTVSDKVK